MAPEFTGKYPSVTSFRRDGSGVATPVWFVAEDRRLLVGTDRDSYEAKRIRRNPEVRVALCTASGKLRARTEFLPESERPRVEALFARKYCADRAVYRAVQRLRGRGLRGDERPVVLSITPI